MNQLKVIELLCMLMIIMQPILLVLELKMFQKKLKSSQEKKHVVTIIYRVEAYDSIMCGHFCVEFIAFMFKGISANLFSPNNYENNDEIMLKFFQ